MRKLTSMLLATAASAALACGLAGSASAFEVVDWNWTANIVEDWDIDVTIDVALVPTGIVKIEKLQMSFGDINANAAVGAIANNPPVTGTGTGIITVPINGAGEFDLSYVDPADNNNPNGPAGTVIPVVVDPGGLNLSLSGGQANENTNTLSGIEYTIDGEVEVDLSEIDFGDAIDVAALPEVVNAATAVANNQQIVSSSALMLHDAQIAAGDINPIGRSCDNECGSPDPLAFLIAAYLLTEVDDELEGLNEHTDIAALTILGAATGFIDPAEINANALALGISNATVDNTATAVGNNASYEVTDTTPANLTMIADLTQLLIGDVSANAAAGFIEVNNYDLTGLDRPLVNNVATAVGNNLNIKVGVADVGDGG